MFTCVISNTVYIIFLTLSFHVPFLQSIPTWCELPLICCYFIYFKKYFIYLFLERAEGRENETEGNINQLPLAPNQGPGRHPRHVP